MNKRLKRICENLGWSVWDYDNDIEFHRYSPAGEDFFFAVNKDNYLSEIIEYAENFDADDHAEMWVNNMHNVKGVPQSIRALIDDADAIKEMLLKLAKNLSKGVKNGKFKN